MKFMKLSCVCFFTTWTLLAQNAVAPMGNIQLKGPIGTRLDQMIHHHVLATDMKYITEPFLEKSERHGWWQTEFWGKFMHSAVPFYTATRNEKLKAQIDAGLETILSSQESSGYIGNYPDELRCGEGWDVWGMKYTLMGLLHYYDGFPSTAQGQKALTAAMKLCDYVIQELGPTGRRGKPLYKTGNWCGLASSSILEPVMWLYLRTKEPRYLGFATYLVKGMTDCEDGPRLLDLALKGISVADRNGYGNQTDKNHGYVMKYNRWKAYEMMSCYQGLINYADVTGRSDLMDAAKATYRQILKDEINVAGGCSSNEAWFHGKDKQHLPYKHLQETCVTTTWMRFSETLLTRTNDPIYADELEKTFYNVYLASLNRSADEFAAYTPLNGYRFRGHHHCRMHTNCCNANGPRGFLAFIRSLLQAHDETAVLNFFVSGRSQIRLPKSGREIILETYTDYPKKGKVLVTNHTIEKGTWTLAVRIPSWSGPDTMIKVNGQDVNGVHNGKYCEITREWEIGDLIEINIDLAVKVHQLNHYVAFTHGPIVLARDTRFGDGPLDEPFRLGSIKPQNPPQFTITQNPSEDFWMTFSATVPIGSHDENPEGANNPTIHFCDYASGANLWQPCNACRVWFPLEWSVME